MKFDIGEIFPYPIVGSSNTLKIIWDWVSVKERMPPVNTCCIVAKIDEPVPLQDIAWFLEHSEGYYFCIGYDKKQSWIPTHWIALPELPTKGEKNDTNT